MLQAMHILIISGLSGSGKSIALNLLEDAAYYCVDNLPPQLLQPLVDQLGQQGYGKIAVAIDIRGGGIETLPQQLDTLRAQKHDVQFLFLDSKTETLRKRYSETRRRHPLASDERTLSESIAEERVRLARVAELGHHIDKDVYKTEAPRLRAELLDIQYEVLAQKAFPVVILVSGVDGSGKGETINLLYSWMDPRHISTLA